MLPREASRPRRAAVVALRALGPALAAALALGTGACGDEDDAGPAEPAGGGTALTVTLDPDGPDGNQEPLTEEVACEGDGEEPACRAIAGIDPADLEPVPPDSACTQLYGGPDTASLQGTIAGEEIDVELTRSDGCEIGRFDAAAPLFKALFPNYVPGSSLDA